MESDIIWADVNYKEAARFLVLGRPKGWNGGLSRILPHRRHKKGTKPGLTGTGPAGAKANDEVQWVFPRVELTEKEKKLIVSEVLRADVQYPLLFIWWEGVQTD